MAESVRADAWTWAVRVYKTRSMASAACKAGHVSVNGTKVKASHPVRIGDKVEALTPGGLKIYVVTRVIAKRVGATVAAAPLGAFTRELLSEVWQQAYGGSDRTVDVHLSWLRRKLGESAAQPRYLLSVRGVGVRLVDPDDRDE